MNKHIATEDVASKAGEFFPSDYHCAESIVAAVAPTLEEYSQDEINLAIKCATPFGGGLGKSFCEACGVITGAGIVIGLAYGRDKEGDDWNHPAELIAKFRASFLNQHKSTNCGTLRERFGDDQLHECQKLVMAGAEELIKLLKEKPQPKS